MPGPGRAILSRPRTRIYDANYSIGENYYRPVLDRVDRKHYGRALTPPRNRGLPAELLERHDRAFFDEDLETSRRRASKHITEGHLFDSRGARISQRLDALENDISQETASSLKRIRANKKVSVVDDVDLESTVNNISSRRHLDRSERLLKSVGIGEDRDKDVSYKRRSLKVTYEDGDDLTRWTPVVKRERDFEAEIESKTTSAAALRAKQSREKIHDIEDEMAALAEKQAVRERRAARLKALLAESTEETEAAQSAIQAISYKSRREQKTVDE